MYEDTQMGRAALEWIARRLADAAAELEAATHLDRDTHDTLMAAIRRWREESVSLTLDGGAINAVRTAVLRALARGPVGLHALAAELEMYNQRLALHELLRQFMREGLLNVVYGRTLPDGSPGIRLASLTQAGRDLLDAHRRSAELHAQQRGNGHGGAQSAAE